jgi:hypothetical protein
MPIPNKGFFDPEPELESIQHHEDERLAFKAALEQQDKEQEEINARLKVQEDERQQKAHAAEIRNLEQFSNLARDPMTRDMILERIRRMREEKPKEIVPPPLSEADKRRLEKEQADGRAALAMVQAKMQGIELPAEVSETTPVHHPNPSQNEIFPTVRSTLPPKPRR